MKQTLFILFLFPLFLFAQKQDSITNHEALKYELPYINEGSAIADTLVFKNGSVQLAHIGKFNDTLFVVSQDGKEYLVDRRDLSYYTAMVNKHKGALAFRNLNFDKAMGNDYHISRIHGLNINQEACLRTAGAFGITSILLFAGAGALVGVGAKNGDLNLSYAAIGFGSAGGVFLLSSFCSLVRAGSTKHYRYLSH